MVAETSDSLDDGVDEREADFDDEEANEVVLHLGGIGFASELAIEVLEFVFDDGIGAADHGQNKRLAEVDELGEIGEIF